MMTELDKNVRIGENGLTVEEGPTTQFTTQHKEGLITEFKDDVATKILDMAPDLFQYLMDSRQSEKGGM